MSLLDHPVVNVTHADAVAFCAWAGLRLPTAAEWTRAELGDETTSCPCDGRHGQSGRHGHAGQATFQLDKRAGQGQQERSPTHRVAHSA